MNQLATLAQPESSALDIFNFEGHNVRTTTLQGDLWFVANDVAGALLYSEASAMTRHLDDDERGLSTWQTPSGDQQMLVINESGLYSAILRSRKPEAKRFKKWVTSVLIPGIRKKEFVHVSQMQVSGNVLAQISASYESLKQDMEELKKAFFTSQPRLQLVAVSNQRSGGVSRAEIRERGLMAPTQLAKRLGISTPRLHAILEVLGLQSRVANRYFVTAKAHGHHEVVGVTETKRKGSVEKFLWKESVITEIPKQYL